MLPLLLGVIAIAASLALLCAAATGVGSTRKTLYAVADASALAAAQSFALDLAAPTPGEGLDAAGARAAAEAVAARIPTAEPVLIGAVAVDRGGTVTLTATTDYDTGLEVFGIPLRTPISVTVDGRAVVR